MHRPEHSPVPHASTVWMDYVRRIHAGLNLDAVGYAIANETRRRLGCDRVSVIVLRRGRARMLAVSGQSSFDRRSNTIRALETLAETAASGGETFVYDETPRPTAPQIETALANLLELTHARRLIVAPLRRSEEITDESRSSASVAAPQQTETLGLLLVEHFEAVPLDTLPTVAQAAANYAAEPLASALEYDGLPLRRVGEAIRSATRGRGLSRTALVVGTLLLVACLLTFVTADLTVEATGVLQPRARRHVFAPSDGVVVEVDVRHGAAVAKDQRLLTLRRPELDFELARVSGEIQTTTQRLSAVETTRLRGAGSQPESYDPLRLTAEAEQLKQMLKGLNDQHAELIRQRQALVVTAPLAGQVLTWDVERQLAARPVQKGQLLLTVGDVAGDWELELRVPDEYIGYVRTAQAEHVADHDGPPTIEYRLASADRTTHVGALEVVDARSETDEQGNATVRVVGSVGDVPRDELRVGAVVAAKITCGRAPLGYVWFLDLIHAARTRLFF